MPSASEKRTELMEKVAAPIIASIEEGMANPNGWTAPWNTDPALMTPICAATGRAYTAGNRMNLAIMAMFFGAEPHWGTFNQWKNMSKHSTACNKSATNAGTRREKRPDCGADCELVTVRKGEKSMAHIFRPRLVDKVDEETGEKKKTFIGFSAYAVFHAGQVDGYDIPTAEPVADVDVAGAFEFLKATGARYEVSAFAGASYSPTNDTICLPEDGRWTSAERAWSTIAHELGHWTGHETRLNRPGITEFDGKGTPNYAFEELVAELSAAFTCSELGISSEPRPDHADYLASWARVLREDSGALWKAAGLAEKASGFVLDAAGATTEVAA